MLAIFFAPRHGLGWARRAAHDRDVVRVAYAQMLKPDPHEWTFPLPMHNRFILSLWEPLIECDPVTGEPCPAAAAEWRWSDDRRILEIRLRPDGRWSNGDRVTASDFVRAWRRLIQKDLNCAAALFPVRNAESIHRGEIPDPSALGVEAVDELTLRVHLKAERSTFVAELADPLLVPIHVTTAEVLASKRVGATATRLITNGAFRLVQASAEGYRMEASPFYRERASVRLAGAEFVRADSPAMARLLLAVGRADIVEPPNRGGPAGLPTDRGVIEETEMSLMVTSLDLNSARGPLRDVRVRRALALAVDRAGAIASNDTDNYVSAHSWVPNMPGRPGLNLMREDPVEARRLLAEAGFPGGKDFPVLILPVNPRRENYGFLQTWTERWYRELGVRTYLSFDLPDKRKTRVERGEFDVLLGGLIATVPDAGDLLGIFADPKRFNVPQWADPEVSRMLDEANRRTGAERLEILERLERRVMDAVLTIPMLFQRRRTLVAAEVEGWYADPLGRQALRRLSIRSSEHLPPVGGGAH